MAAIGAGAAGVTVGRFVDRGVLEKMNYLSLRATRLAVQPAGEGLRSRTVLVREKEDPGDRARVPVRYGRPVCIAPGRPPD